MKARFSQVLGTASVIAATAVGTEALGRPVYMKLEGVKGDVTADGHLEEIEIDSFSLGLSNSGGTAAGGTSGAGKASFQDLHVTGRVSRVSPTLALLCATGKEVPSAKLTFQTKAPDGKLVDLYVVNLTKVRLSSVQSGGASGESRPSESFSLNYATIEWVVQPIDSNGKLGTPVRTKYSLETATGQ